MLLYNIGCKTLSAVTVAFCACLQHESDLSSGPVLRCRDLEQELESFTRGSLSPMEKYVLFLSGLLWLMILLAVTSHLEDAGSLVSASPEPCLYLTVVRHYIL
jgi:D-alanyl-lipoteichoic acid acyltransferase DltB (MBOAT superfamily)